MPEFGIRKLSDALGAEIVGLDATAPVDAATAAALLDGRPLRGVPVMECIFEASIAAWPRRSMLSSPSAHT